MISACNDILISWQDTPSFSASIFFFISMRISTRISARSYFKSFSASFWPPRVRSRRDPGENLGEMSSRSRRESRRVFGRRDLEIWPGSRRDLEIKTRRDSRRDLGQNFAGVAVY